MLLDPNFLQPVNLIKDVGYNENIICKVDYFISETFHNFEIIETFGVNLSSFLSLQNLFKIILRTHESESEFNSGVKVEIVDKKLYFEAGLHNIITEIKLKNFMWFEIHLEAAPNTLYECLDAELTIVGDSQFKLLEKHLTTLSKLCRVHQDIYAPLTSFVQSSGFGKTKMCLELLKKHPGVYLVFRKVTDTGIPHMAPYMKKFIDFITNAPKDELPLTMPEIYRERAFNYTPGRFLIALYTFIKAYHDLLVDAIERVKAERNPLFVGEDAIIIEAIRRLGANYMFEPYENALYNLNVDFDVNQDLTFDILIAKISEECYAINKTIKRIHDTSSKSMSQEITFPFLFFLDEADIFNKSNLPGKIHGINVIRRGLHLLNPTTPLLSIAIGTNSDALEFSPAVNDDSLRVLTRNKLLPPFIMSGNWDIFSAILEFDALELGSNELLNRNLFNLLVVMGRAMWSSCKLGEIVQIAMRKLKNGDRNSIAALVAPLLVRANIDVNVNHVLARNLVKSYMIVVNYVSTDAKNLKISYSSEPMLAFASRNLLNSKVEREKSFRALKKMLEDKAIDKGRIVEVVFEHLALFAVDDVEMTEVKKEEDKVKVKFSSEPEEEKVKFSSESMNHLPKNIYDIVSKTSFILDDKVQTENSDSGYKLERELNYRIVTMNQYFSKLLKRDLFKIQIKPMIHESVLKGLANISHFIQFEHLMGEDLKGLYEENLLCKLLKKVIDRSSLKCGIIRTFGVVMPPGYPGIDFFIPYLIDDPKKKFKRPLYSFIAFQSKASKTTTSDCAYKMAASLHLINCPHSTHNTPDDCAKANCSAGFTQEEIDEICANQVVFLLAAKNDEQTSDRKTKITVALKGYKISSSPKSAEEKARINDEKSNILNICNNRYGDHIFQATNEVKEAINISAVSYPAFSKSIDYETPDFILTKFINSQVKVQRMVWDGGLRDYQYVGKVSKDAETNTKPKSKKPLDFLKTTRPRTLTCIDIHDIWAFDDLLSENTIAVILEMFSMTNSNFHSVEPIHLPIVQNSMINGKFCTYHACNPQINKMRDLALPTDPTKDDRATNEFELKWASTVEACAKGPVNANLDPLMLPADYSSLVKPVVQSVKAAAEEDDDDDSDSDRYDKSIDDDEYHRMDEDEYYYMEI